LFVSGMQISQYREAARMRPNKHVSGSRAAHHPTRGRRIIAGTRDPPWGDAPKPAYESRFSQKNSLKSHSLVSSNNETIV
jgi:hypothetical protein